MMFESTHTRSLEQSAPYSQKAGCWVSGAEREERGLGGSWGLFQFCKVEVVAEQQEECPQACTAAALTTAETWK